MTVQQYLKVQSHTRVDAYIHAGLDELVPRYMASPDACVLADLCDYWFEP
jgi:hypothetical protein